MQKVELYTRLSKKVLKTLESTVELCCTLENLLPWLAWLLPYIQTGDHQQYIIIIHSDWSKSLPNKPACTYQWSCNNNREWKVQDMQYHAWAFIHVCIHLTEFNISNTSSSFILIGPNHCQTNQLAHTSDHAIIIESGKCKIRNTMHGPLYMYVYT